MAQYTRQGEQYIAEKAGTDGAFVVTHFVLANIDGLDPTVQPSPDEVMPPEAAIVDVKPVTQKGYLNSNQTVFSLVLDSSIGDYEFNWIGLKTDDGRLLSVAYDAPQQKLRYEGAQEGNNITRNFVIEFEGAKDAAAITVSAETWQVDFTARLNQIDENTRLISRDMFGQSTFFGEGFKVIRAGNDHIVKAGLGYIEGIRLFLINDINLGPVVDKAVWIDASMLNDGGLVIGNAVPKVSPKSVNEENYHTTEQHYLLKIADVDYNGIVLDSRHVMGEEINSGGVAKGLKVFAENEVAAFAAVVSSMFAGQVSAFPGTKLPLGWLKANGQTILRAEYSFLWAYANASENIAVSEADKTAAQFGPGDGVNTFTLPDLRGQHLRYWDDGRGVDDGRVIGSEQEDDIKQHKHDANASRDGSHKHNASTGYDGEHTHIATTAASGEHRHRLNIKDADDASSGGGHRYRPNSGGTELTDYAGSHGHKITVKSSSTHNHSVNVLSEGTHGHTITIANKGIAENRVKNVALMVCIKY